MATTTTHSTGPMDVPVTSEPEQERPRKPRGKVFLVIGVVILAVLVGAFVWWLSTRGKESTDDAQVQADIVSLAPRVPGAVARVAVRENEHVAAGQPVLELDDADYTLKVTHAEADVQAAEAAVARAKPQERLDTVDLARSKGLIEQHAIPKQDLDRAEAQARSGRAGLAQAQATLAAARAALAEARLQLSYVTVTAPADGHVSNITAHPGQLLAADEPFAQFVPDHAYVVANFKETQIGRMRPGDRASITLDAYGHRAFEGRIESLSSGTGAAFSLLPANNATGNFVKVVQRVPVRIELLQPPPDLPLRAGLSADVTVYLP